MAKTIYTYLHNDDLNGSRVVYMDNCFCKLFKIQRADGDFLQLFKGRQSRLSCHHYPSRSSIAIHDPSPHVQADG